jgi:hypothetical protein
MVTKPDEIQPVAIAADVDWLTITVKSTDARRRLMESYSETVRDLKDSGERLGTWRFKGYQGVAIGGFRWGTRPDSDIVMLSGYEAALYWKTFLPLAENVTRVDLAVTVEIDRPCPDLLIYYYDWDQETEQRGLKHQTRWRVTFFQNNNGGQTLNVGARASDQMGRVYDKAAQQGMTDHLYKLWRYEVEFKQNRASKLAQSLNTQGISSAKLRDDIRKTVYLWFSGRDVPPIFSAKGDEFSLEVQAKVTSDEATLKWFSSQVAPSVRRLIEKGRLEEVKEALGIALDENTN